MFLVIAATVVLQGLSGSLVASLLGLRRRSDFGYAVVGPTISAECWRASSTAVDEPVVMIDANADDMAAAKKDGMAVIFGNAHDERVLYRADVEGRRAVIADYPERRSESFDRQSRARPITPTEHAGRCNPRSYDRDREAR